MRSTRPVNCLKAGDDLPMLLMHHDSARRSREMESIEVRASLQRQVRALSSRPGFVLMPAQDESSHVRKAVLGVAGEHRLPLAHVLHHLLFVGDGELDGAEQEAARVGVAVLVVSCKGHEARWVCRVEVFADAEHEFWGQDLQHLESRGQDEEGRAG